MLETSEGFKFELPVSLANTVVDVSNVTLGLSATINFDETLPIQRKQKLQTANKRLHFLCFSGKWCRVERFHVPEKYVQALLADMPNSFINSARGKRHFHPLCGEKKLKCITTGTLKSMM